MAVVFCFFAVVAGFVAGLAAVVVFGLEAVVLSGMDGVLWIDMVLIIQ